MTDPASQKRDGPTRQIAFTKMHGAGNDFVVLDAIAGAIPEGRDLAAFAERVAHRQLGVGFDQMLVVRRPHDPDQADFRMEIYNGDGSQVEMCGNGVRAFYKYLRDRGYTSADSLRVETLAGVVVPRWAGADRVRVDMGRPLLAPAKIPTTLAGGDGPVIDATLEVACEQGTRSLVVSSVSMGNPHVVVVVESVDDAPVGSVGPAIERHPAFPARTNVEFIEVLDRTRIRQRTWERGTGETLACGSGACAAGVTSMLRGVVDEKVTVSLRGGDLEIEWAGGDAPVFMTGPAAEVFTGRIPIS